MNNIFEKEIYWELYPTLLQAEKIIDERLMKEIGKVDIPTLVVTHRIKDESSALEKLRRKPELYKRVLDLNDLIGFRIICYFSDDVDKIADIVQKLFVVDFEHSVDKRQMLSPTAFGYLSLHYICSLPECEQYPKKVSDVRFEIQMRSALQHTWAEIEHDLGYKSVFAVPREIRREFSRIAGLLELADESFTRIREKIKDYTEKTTEDIKNGNAENLSLDLVTLTAFLRYNQTMNKLVSEIAALQNAAVTEHSPENYLHKLAMLNVTTVGELEKLTEKEYNDALTLAKELFSSAEIDEMVSTVGLHFICRAAISHENYSAECNDSLFMKGNNNDP